MDLDFLDAPEGADLGCSHPGKLRIPGVLNPQILQREGKFPNLTGGCEGNIYLVNGRNGEFQGIKIISRE